MKKITRNALNNFGLFLLTACLFLAGSIMEVATSSAKSVTLTMGGKFYAIPAEATTPPAPPPPVPTPTGCTDEAIAVDYPTPIVRVPLDYTTIQDAIQNVPKGGTVLVSDGIYSANITVIGGSTKTVYIYSENGPATTIIQGTGSGTVVTFSNYSQSVISGFTITNGNNTSGNGGGIIVGTGATPTIENCIITGNQAWLGGGGIHLTPTSAPTIERCIISSNETTGYTTESNGAAVHVAADATATIRNCTITDNSSSFLGGAIAVYAGTIKVINSTFSNNSAFNYGGAIALNTPLADTLVTNSIFWGNSDLNGLNQISLSDQSTLSGVTYSDIQGGYPGTGNINLDPNFIGGGNYHLQTISPAIDKGTSENMPLIDIDGNCRPKGYGHDMGSDEAK